jgi:acyl-CoA thioesterase
MRADGWEFDSETSAVTVGENMWQLTLSDSWNIGQNSNGGYLAATVVNNLGRMVEHPHAMTVTTHFLRPGVGSRSADITGRVVKLGNRMSTVAGTLSQLGKPRVEVLAGFGDLSAGPAAQSLSYAPPDLPKPDECVDRVDLEQGVDLPILDRVDVMIRPDQAVAGESPDAKVSGWIRFVDGRPPDAAALVLFADAFPPSLFARYGFIGWVPTLELTVHVRRVPAEGWVRAVFETDDLHNGLFVESGSLWDSNGELVARSRQVAMLRELEAS